MSQAVNSGHEGPLAGYKVLDLSRTFAGPYCGMMLAELGADVVKVEEPTQGDECRQWPPFAGEYSAYFFAMNRSKRSLTLNLKSPEGQRLFLELAKQADVVLHNYPPGIDVRLGVDYETVRSVNPEVVYCAITGFGQTGPYRHRRGYDPIVQAMGGVMSVTGTPEHGPTKVGVPIGDISAALYASQAILAALVEKARSGRGQFIDTSLFDSMIGFLTVQAAIWFAERKVPGRLGNEHPGRVPSATLECADGRLIHVVVNDLRWEAFCKLLGREDWARNPRYRTNRQRVEAREELMPAIREAFRTKTAREWDRLLTELDIPCGVVNNIDEVFSDPHVIERGMAASFHHPVLGEFPAIGIPYKMSRTPAGIKGPPPDLGQHTEEVLREWLGMEAEEVASLRARGVV